MKKLKYKLTATVQLGSENPARYLFTLNKEISDEIKQNFGGAGNTYGSVPVNVSIRTTTWATALIFKKDLGVYLLPLKKEVREKEEIVIGAEVSFTVQIKESVQTAEEPTQE